MDDETAHLTSFLPELSPKPYRDPASIIAEIIFAAKPAARASKTAQRVLEALRAEGWRVLR